MRGRMMSYFDEAFKPFAVTEGIFSDHESDPGGETYRGISRYWFPGWEGWPIVDKYKADFRRMPHNVLNNLNHLIRTFYKSTFWDRIHGDEIAAIDKQISIKLFDTAAHRSVETGIEILQKSLNLLNLNASIYPDLLVDGKLGPITKRTLERYMASRPGSIEINRGRLLKVWSIIQGWHAIKQMHANPEKEVFRGWFDRA